MKLFYHTAFSIEVDRNSVIGRKVKEYLELNILHAFEQSLINDKQPLVISLGYEHYIYHELTQQLINQIKNYSSSMSLNLLQRLTLKYSLWRNQVKKPMNPRKAESTFGDVLIQPMFLCLIAKFEQNQYSLGRFVRSQFTYEEVGVLLGCLPMHIS